MEFFDIVDENNQLIGRTEERELVHKNGLWHREVAVWIMNERNEILLQKRATTKKQSPNKWGICAGHIDAGETKENAVIRELEEELGIKATIEDLEFLCIKKVKSDFPNLKNYMFQYMYFFKTNLKLEEYKIQLEELSEVKYISLVKLEEAVKNKEQEMTFARHNYMSEIIEILREKAEEI